MVLPKCRKSFVNRLMTERQDCGQNHGHFDQWTTSFHSHQFVISFYTILVLSIWFGYCLLPNKPFFKLSQLVSVFEGISFLHHIVLDFKSSNSKDTNFSYFFFTTNITFTWVHHIETTFINVSFITDYIRHLKKVVKHFVFCFKPCTLKIRLLKMMKHASKKYRCAW